MSFKQLSYTEFVRYI